VRFAEFQPRARVSRRLSRPFGEGVKSPVSQTPTDLLTERLILRPLTPAFLEASLDEGSRREAADRLGLTIPDDWFEQPDLARLRLEDLRADPSYQEWSLRAIAERATRRMVGHVGFHSRPAPAYLLAWAPRGVEIGLEVYPASRRLGYAREAIRGLVRWAHGTQGVSQFVASVAPDNAASLALVAGLGFVPVGRREDEADGEEVVLLLAGGPLWGLVGATAPGHDG
jgi:RimJ/RimL family protein N-acetyltransferase